MSIFTSDYKPTPYWWEAAPLDTTPPGGLPAHVDVAIIGSGYTGLHAAYQTASAGRSTLVLEAETPGFGASSRNGGQISTSVKGSLPELTKRYGKDLALDLLREGAASLAHVKDFVERHNLDCDLQVEGRFHAAYTSQHYDKLAKGLNANIAAFDDDAYMVPRSDQHAYLKTDVYHGGIMTPHHANLHPGKYHRALLALVRNAGAQVEGRAPVTNIARNANGFALQTPRGTVQASRVILATNGYTGKLTPWQQRRVIPIGSYIIATEPLAPDVMDCLMPTNANLTDSRKLVYYYRPSPDRTRILFGGRVSVNESDPNVSAPRLLNELCRLIPDLDDVKISHSWTGMVGYTFDSLPHVGQDDGLFYAMGYCGSGVGMASYLGMRIGQQAVDNPDGMTAFNKIRFPTRPFYTGNPWFLGPSVMAYRIRDRLGL